MFDLSYRVHIPSLLSVTKKTRDQCGVRDSVGKLTNYEDPRKVKKQCIQWNQNDIAQEVAKLAELTDVENSLIDLQAAHV